MNSATIPPAMGPKRKLTPKEKLFKSFFLIHGNGARAAREAGYSEKSAKDIAAELLKKPLIIAAIEAESAKVLSKLDVTVERVLQERARLAFADPRQLFREDGTPIPVHELPEDAARALAGIKTDGRFVGRGKARKWVSAISEYKLANKSESLTALEKHLGMYRDEGGGDGALAIHIHLN